MEVEGTDVTVRPAVPDDAPGLRACQVACWREAYGALVPAGFFDRYADADTLAEAASRWRTVIAADGPRTAVAVDAGGQVVGFGNARATPPDQDGTAPPRRLELGALYVRAHLHGRGVADRLLALTVADAPACLWVFEDNPRARAFYARHGFAPDGTRVVDSWTGLVELRLVR